MGFSVGWLVGKPYLSSALKVTEGSPLDEENMETGARGAEKLQLNRRRCSRSDICSKALYGIYKFHVRLFFFSRARVRLVNSIFKISHVFDKFDQDSVENFALNV